MKVPDELVARGFRSEEETRSKLGLAPGTLKVWRAQKRGPRFYKLNSKLVLYRDCDVDQWIEQQAREPTAA